MVAAALIAFLVLAQGASAPFEKDAEPQSAEWIVSVVRDGRWLMPLDYYGHIDRKPPLYYWLSGIATRLSGGIVDETRARIVSMAAGTALAVGLLAWMATYVGAVEGWIAFLFLLGTYGFASRATLALTDMLMTALVMGAYVAIYPLLEGERAPRRALCAGVVLGLGILAKGPVALVLVALAAFIFCLIERRNPFRVLTEAWPWQVTVVALAIAACWYVPWMVEGGDRVVRIFVHENLGHFLPSRYGGTGEAARPIWYIVARIIGGAMPIVILVPAAAAALATGEIAGARRKPLLYQMSLVLAVVGFFSVASAKRDDYILPALPGIAVLCASVMALDESGDGARRWGVRLRDIAIGLIAIMMMTAVGAAMIIALLHLRQPLRMQSSDSDQLALLERGLRGMRSAFVMFALGVIVAGATALVALRNRSAIVAGAAVGVISLAGSLLFNATVRPELDAERSVKSFIPAVREAVDGHPLMTVTPDNYELSFYWGGPVPMMPRDGSVASSTDHPAYLFAYGREVRTLPESTRKRLKLIVRSHLIDGAGPPAIYEIGPETGASGLNTSAGMGR